MSVELDLAALGHPALRNRAVSCCPSTAFGGSNPLSVAQTKKHAFGWVLLFGGARRDRTADLNTASVL